MKIPQFLPTHLNQDNKSFQKELWDRHWSQTSFDNLVSELFSNPIYWNLLNKISKNDHVLEAGCGFGQWVWQLNSLGYSVVGIDNAQNTIRRLKQNFPKLKLKIGDVEKLPFENESFDVYLSFGVVEHFEKGPQKVLMEARRVLKQNGLLYLTIPYLNFFRFMRFYFSSKKGSFYQYLYSTPEMISIVERAGFTIKQVSFFDFINAITKDFPFVKFFLNKDRQPLKNSKKGAKKLIAENKQPNFNINKLLYKLDSYVLLIEARKSNL